MNDRLGIMDMLKRGFGDAKTEVKQMGADLTKKALDTAIGSDVVQKEGAKYIKVTIVDTVKDIKDHTGSLVSEAKKKIVGETDIKVYDQIREGLKNPQDGIFTNIFKNVVARVMSGAAGIGGWIGATFVNTAFNPAQAEKVNPNDVTQIFGSFMSKVFAQRTAVRA